jgi:negative regulator of genetic competence, sporulation and motility
MKTAQKIDINPDDPPTFEKVWKMFQETDRKFQETKEQIAATDRQIRETDKKVGELTNRFGDMVEYMVVPNLLAKFKSLDFAFEVAHKNTEIKDEKNNIFVEVDVFLENGDKVMIVEIKATPSAKDVDDHRARMEKLRKYADSRRDTRTYLGAVAGVVMSDSVKNYALKQGFFVVVPSGDTFTIIKPEGKYHVKEW